MVVGTLGDWFQNTGRRCHLQIDVNFKVKDSLLKYCVCYMKAAGVPLLTIPGEAITLEFRLDGTKINGGN